MKLPVIGEESMASPGCRPNPAALMPVGPAAAVFLPGTRGRARNSFLSRRSCAASVTGRRTGAEVGVYPWAPLRGNGAGWTAQARRYAAAPPSRLRSRRAGRWCKTEAWPLVRLNLISRCPSRGVQLRMDRVGPS